MHQAYTQLSGNLNQKKKAICPWLMCMVSLTVGPSVLWIMCTEVSPSPLSLFLLLLDEAEGAIDSDQAIYSSKLQVLLARAAKCIVERG
jgi:hypothetical protein